LGISTTTTWSTAVEIGPGGTAAAAVAATVAATATATSCCSPAASAAPRGGLLVAATHPAALDERRLVGTDVPELSTLVGARLGTIGAAMSTRRQEFELRPFETQASEEAAAYLKVEKPRFLFIEGSADAVVAADAATAALPDASAARPSVDRLVAGAPAPAPGACSFAASAALGEGGRRLPPLRGARPPSLSSSSPSPDDEYSEVAGGESPCCSRIWCSSSLCSRCSRRQILRSFLRATRSCSCRCAARACARALGVGGSDRAAFTATLCWEE
jgi:hypothetical protein